MRAVLITAPTPVMTAQPKSAASASGTVLVDHDHAAAIDHRVLGHAGQARMMIDALAVQRGDAATAGHQLAGRLGDARALADLRPPFDAAPAAAAGRRELEHHVVADADVVDGRADLDHLARALRAPTRSAPGAADRR